MGQELKRIGWIWLRAIKEILEGILWNVGVVAALLMLIFYKAFEYGDIKLEAFGNTYNQLVTKLGAKSEIKEETFSESSHQ